MAAADNLDSFRPIKYGSEKQFCLIFFLVFAFYGLYPLFQKRAPHGWAILVAILFLVLYFFAPKVVRPLHKIWMKIGVILGKVMTPLIMALIYFTAVFFLGLILRLFKRSNLHVRSEPLKNTYWIKKDPEENVKESFIRQF